MYVKININNLRAIAPLAANSVKHFARNACRLHGLLAFREQLNIAQETGRYETFALVEADMEEIKINIVNLASRCADNLMRLNTLAYKNDIGPVCIGIGDASLSTVIEYINDYVDALVERSDYRDWVDEVNIEV